jgi:hypothetical protein
MSKLSIYSFTAYHLLLMADLATEMIPCAMNGHARKKITVFWESSIGCRSD